ncbi:MAG: nicotinate (nicotinamide) nucleotide adenylyltransferase [bacterium]|nr:nicotinate (nicotinamide) nucleotide adenylyltransferase [bacterium]
MSDARRIGIYGGTFDPVHNAHMRIAQTALDEADLDEVVFVVAARPPHKGAGPVADPEERYAMVDAAVNDVPRMSASRVELDRDGPSYMVDTLIAFEHQYPGADLLLIVGMDSLIDLPQWRDPEGILSRARLLVVGRPGTWDVPASLRGHYEVLPFEPTDLSSTEVRARIAAGESPGTLIPSGAAAVVERKGMYRG